MKKMPLLNDYIDYWSEKRPDRAAMIQHEDGKTITYRQFRSFIDYFALRLIDMGIRKGDRVATQLVLVPVSNKRPQHIEIWPRDKAFPFTRSAKIDKLKLAELAADIIERLRRQGKWDAV